MLHHSPPPVFTCITSKWKKKKGQQGEFLNIIENSGFFLCVNFVPFIVLKGERRLQQRRRPFPTIHSFTKKVKKKPHSAFNISLAHVFLMVNMLTVDSAKKKKKPKLPKMLFLLLRQLYCTLHSTKYAVPFVHIDSYVTAWRRKNPGERVLVLHSLWGLGFCRGQEEEMPWRKIVITTCSETE